MRRILAAALSAPLLLLAAACSPAETPAPTNAAANGTDDELLDTSPDSLAAPDDANSVADTNMVQDNIAGER